MATSSHGTIVELLETVFSMWSVPRCYITRTQAWEESDISPCGGGVKYLHRSPASHRRRRKLNPVPGSITGPLCSWRNISTGTWCSMLGESRIWDSKIWSRVPRDSASDSAIVNHTHVRTMTASVQLKEQSWSWVSRSFSSRQTDWR
jgi:hypothetical protein